MTPLANIFPLFLRLTLTILLLSLNSCIWPLKVAEELDVQIIDADSEEPIPNAEVVYLACDVHNFDCSHARLIRTKANGRREISIDSERRWGPWIPAVGGIPAPSHLIAIWAPGYSIFVFSQYEDSVDSRMKQTKRQDIIDALREIPPDHIMNEESLNPREELIGGKIKLVRK